jgi:hypothetical protein
MIRGWHIRLPSYYLFAFLFVQIGMCFVPFSLVLVSARVSLGTDPPGLRVRGPLEQ